MAQPPLPSESALLELGTRLRRKATKELISERIARGSTMRKKRNGMQRLLQYITC
jgi:hypothetical protein